MVQASQSALGSLVGIYHIGLASRRSLVWIPVVTKYSFDRTKEYESIHIEVNE